MTRLEMLDQIIAGLNAFCDAADAFEVANPGLSVCSSREFQIIERKEVCREIAEEAGEKVEFLSYDDEIADYTGPHSGRESFFRNGVRVLWLIPKEVAP